MNEEALFEALSDVGDDLLVMAENRRFVSPWRKWGQTAAVMAVVLCLSALTIPYFNASCGAADRAVHTKSQMPMAQTTMECAVEEAAEETVEETAPTADATGEGQAAADIYDGTDEEGVTETDAVRIEAEEPQETEQDMGAVMQRTKIVCRGTYFYLLHDVEIKGVPPLGEKLGEITWSDDPSLVGRQVYTVPYSAWFDNFAVDGEGVSQQVYVQTPGGYYYGTTSNEKIASRYTMDDVRLAINKENHIWLTDTFALPIEQQGGVEFTDPKELSAAELETMFWASTCMNTGVTVADLWFDGENYCVPMEDLRWRLDRVLDEGYVYDPVESSWYDLQLDALVYPYAKVKYDYRELTLLDAVIADDIHLVMRIELPEGIVREYTIRFDEDAWRYESIVTIQ